MRNYLLIKICALLLILCSHQISQAQLAPVTSNAEQAGMSVERLMKLDQRMHQFVDEGQISAVHTLVYRKGQIAHSDIYGHEDIDSKDAIKENSIWRIYSMTKPIVSIGIMQQYEMGKFNLNDPLPQIHPCL